MNEFEVIQLTQEQYDTLVSEGSITVGDKTVYFNDNALYCVPDDIVLPTSASLFTFEGNAIKSYVGNDQDVILPQSYSKIINIETRFGQYLNENRFEMITDWVSDFEYVTFCRADGLEEHTWTDRETFREEFRNFFTDVNDCLLKEVGYPIGMGRGADMLSEVLGNPIYVNGKVFEGTVEGDWIDHREYRDYIMDLIEESESSGTQLVLTFYGDYEISTFKDGFDYTVDTVGVGDVAVFNGSFTGHITVPEGFKVINDFALPHYENAIITLSDSIETIGRGAFWNSKSLFGSTLVLPKNLVNLGFGAVGYCRIEVLKIGKNCTNIELFKYDPSNMWDYNSFGYNENLKRIEVDEENPVYASIDGILYDKNIKTLLAVPLLAPYYAIPETVTEISDGVFYSKSGIDTIIIGENVEKLGESVFCKSTLSSVEFLSEKILELPKGIFFECISLTSITIPNSVISIGNYAFYGCSNLTTVTIGSSVTNIGQSAFAYCRNLKSITIPASVTSIGSYAFRYCSNLIEMTILAETPPTLENSLSISSATTTIYIPAGTLEAYQTATNWSNFSSKFVELS